MDRTHDPDPTNPLEVALDAAAEAFNAKLAELGLEESPRIIILSASARDAEPERAVVTGYGGVQDGGVGAALLDVALTAVQNIAHAHGIPFGVETIDVRELEPDPLADFDPRNFL